MERISEKEVREAYDTIALQYHDHRKRGHIYNDYLERPATISLLGNIRGKRILDLGCGTGILSNDMVKRGAKVDGIDISPKMLEIAKQNIKGVDFGIGSLSKIPFKSGTFDMVVASLVMHYSNNLDKTFMEVRRVLKRDGILIFSSDNPVTHMTEKSTSKERYRRIFGDYFKEGKVYARWKSVNYKMPYQHITMQTWIKTALRSGFTIVDYLDAKPTRAGKRVDRERYEFLSKVPWFFVMKLKKI